MDPEKKEKNSEKEFGSVVDALHSKQKLSSLRTYQGDMAEFIKEKNESVFSIAEKERRRKEDEEKKQKEEEKKIENDLPKFVPEQKSETPKTSIFDTEKKPSKKSSSKWQSNIIILVSSLLLIFGGVQGFLYVYNYFNEKKDQKPINVDTSEIIPFNNVITITNISKNNLGSELKKTASKSGVSIAKISDVGGLNANKSRDFFNLLNIDLSSELDRTIGDKYAVGVFARNEGASPFVIINVDDFGSAFSAMLGWEKTLEKDLAFFTDFYSFSISDQTEANNASSTIKKEFWKESDFVWKDVIVKNKDTRALINSKNQSKIAYAFLDKNTILIIGDVYLVGEMFSVYASRAVAR